MQYKTFETKNYIFNFAEGSLAEKDILTIAEEQENAFCQICETLKLTPNFKITYYLCDSPEEVGRLFGDNEPCNGFADSDDNSVYAVYSDDIKCTGPHEDAHLLSFTIGHPQSRFLTEGLAMFFDKVWWGVDNDLWVKYYISNGSYVSVGELLVNDIWRTFDCTITYPIAGSFTNFLINTFGLEKYLILFASKEANAKDVIKNIYELTAGEIEHQFLEYLNSLSLSNEMYDKMTQLIKEYA